jgi:hypothetical protein
MAAPTVAGAVALYKESRPYATPAEVREALRYLGNLNWKVSTDPDSTHEPLLDVARIRSLGDFDFAPTTAPTRVEAATTASVPVNIVRSPTFFERVGFSITSLPDGWTGSAAPSSLLGWSANAGRLSVVVPPGTPLGRYDIGVEATNQGRVAATTLAVEVVDDDPTASAPTTAMLTGVRMGPTAMYVRVGWPAATDPTSAIAGYETEWSESGGPWTGTVARTAAQRDIVYSLKFDTSYRFRVRAVDAAGNWSPWAERSTTTRIHPVDDRNKAVYRSSSWVRGTYSSAWQTTVIASRSAGARVSLTFTGREIAVIAPKGPKRGTAKIYIDGVYIKTINLRATSSLSRQVVFTRAFPSSGTHTITVRVVGTGTYPTVRLDAFVISR